MPIARALLLFLSCFVIGCSDFTSVPDDRSSFEIDANKPFVIEFGRGSGMHGLDIIRVDHSGQANLTRFERRATPDSTTLQLTDQQVKKVIAFANTSRLTSLAKSYMTNVEDGTQSVLWIEQGTSQKAIYFNNAFPKEITTFADQLDGILNEAGLPNATWTAAPIEEAKERHAALWKRVE